MRLGAIEAGGTKMVLAVGDEKGNILERESIPTTTVEETMCKMVEWFKDKNIEALGIGAFGPIDLHPDSSFYGYITTTPKPGWANTDFIGPFKKALNIPIGFDTDVNAAVLGEVMFGAAKGLDNAIYVTIGTGIGAGVYLNGKLLHGMLHPESGHILLKPHDEDNYKGCCPFHECCFEGLASGPSIEKRWHKKAFELYDNEKVWQLESYYIGQAIANYILCYSPEKIILWGGVMHTPGLIDLIRKETRKILNGYIKTELINDDNYITTPALNDDPGIIGACYLGYLEYLKDKEHAK